MSIVPWNLQKVREDIVSDVGFAKQATQNRNQSQIVPKLPQRAVIVHEVSSDEEQNASVDASSGLAVTVMPSSMTQTQNAGLRVRQAEAQPQSSLSSNKVETRLDELRVLADKAGLSVEEYLESMNMPQNERSQKESTRQARDRFQQETSQTNRDIGTNSREEVAYLVRESIQRVPTNNEAMATSVMRDILAARNQAAELNIKIEMRNPDQISSLRMWVNTRKKPMSDLAEAILSRM